MRRTLLLVGQSWFLGEAKQINAVRHAIRVRPKSLGIDGIYMAQSIGAFISGPRTVEFMIMMLMTPVEDMRSSDLIFPQYLVWSRQITLHDIINIIVIIIPCNATGQLLTNWHRSSLTC